MLAGFTVAFAKLTALVYPFASGIRYPQQKKGMPMYVLRIEHPVPDHDRWKKAFDSDPAGREQAGVRRYRVLRAVDDPAYVMIELEFDTMQEAETLLARMRTIWGDVEGKIMNHPVTRFARLMEAKECGRG
jgi:hypothetical protein